MRHSAKWIRYLCTGLPATAVTAVLAIGSPPTADAADPADAKAAASAIKCVSSRVPGDIKDPKDPKLGDLIDLMRDCDQDFSNKTIQESERRFSEQRRKIIAGLQTLLRNLKLNFNRNTLNSDQLLTLKNATGFLAELFEKELLNQEIKGLEVAEQLLQEINGSDKKSALQHIRLLTEVEKLPDPPEIETSSRNEKCSSSKIPSLPKPQDEKGIEELVDFLKLCHQSIIDEANKDEKRRNSIYRVKLFETVRDLVEKLKDQAARSRLSAVQIKALRHLGLYLVELFKLEFPTLEITRITKLQGDLVAQVKALDIMSLTDTVSHQTEKLADAMNSLSVAEQVIRGARDRITGMNLLRRCPMQSAFNETRTRSIADVRLEPFGSIIINKQPFSFDNLVKITRAKSVGSSSKLDKKSKQGLYPFRLAGVNFFNKAGDKGRYKVSGVPAPPIPEPDNRNEENERAPNTGAAAPPIIIPENEPLEQRRPQTGATAEGLLPGGLVITPERLRKTYFDPYFQSVGALLKQGRLDEPYTFSCSGVLVGRKNFATAAHCIRENLDSGRYKIYLPYAGIFDVENIEWQDRKFEVKTDLKKTRSFGTKADIALLTLGASVSGQPADSEPTGSDDFGHGLKIPYLLGSTEDDDPLPAKVYGFGRRLADKEDAGILRSGNVCTQKCRIEFGNDDLICWTFQPSLDFSKPHLSSTCSGDSGGPVFYRFPESDEPPENRRPVLVALTSGGDVENCGSGDHAFNTRISTHHEWILNTLVESGSCDRNGPVGLCHQTSERKMLAPPFPIHGRFREGIKQRIYTLRVPSQITIGTEVRIGFNGTAKQGLKFNFAVMRDATAGVEMLPGTPVEPFCSTFSAKAESGHGQFGFCRFIAQQGAEFSVIVESDGVSTDDFQVLVSWWDLPSKGPDARAAPKG